MKIGISLLSAAPQRTGVENAVLNLIRQLSSIGGKDEYIVYANRRNLPWLSKLSGSVRVVDVPLSFRRVRWLWEHIFFLTSRRPREVDIVHFPIGGGVVGYGGKFVLTIHDLNHYSNRDFTMLRRHLLWRLWYKANVKRAARIITVSDYVKKHISQEFPSSSNKVRLAPNGVDQRFRPYAPTQDFKEKHQLPERYVLFVGATSVQKNIRRAIEAVNLVRRSDGTDHCLVIAGAPGEADPGLRAYISSNRLDDVVRFVGYFDDTELPQLYSNAALFLFPSIAEGFGIPPLEAMRCAVPVVAAHTSSMPEVLGDAAIWVDPLSVESIAKGISQGLFDQSVRKQAIARGLFRSEQFSWEKMAVETVKVYREATSGKGKSRTSERLSHL